MAIKLEKETEKYLVGSIKRFFAEDMDHEIGDLKATRVLHFFELFVDKTSGAVSHVHLAFQARDRATVHKFHVATLAAGGRDNGGPGERRYHPGYYAAFVLDPDGNKH